MITIGILIFPQVEELDFVGPFEVVSYVNKIKPDSTKVLLIAERAEPITAYNGLKVIPDTSIEESPQLDILIVPGGKGRMAAMHNFRIRDFILQQTEGTLYTTSVCTGALLLAEAAPPPPCLPDCELLPRVVSEKDLYPALIGVGICLTSCLVCGVTIGN